MLNPNQALITENNPSEFQPIDEIRDINSSFMESDNNQSIECEEIPSHLKNKRYRSVTKLSKHSLIWYTYLDKPDIQILSSKKRDGQKLPLLRLKITKKASRRRNENLLRIKLLEVTSIVKKGKSYMTYFHQLYDNLSRIFVWLILKSECKYASRFSLTWV